MAKYTLNGTTYVAANFGKAKSFAIQQENAKRERIERMYAKLEMKSEKDSAIESIPFLQNLFPTRRAQNEFMYSL